MERAQTKYLETYKSKGRNNNYQKLSPRLNYVDKSIDNEKIDSIVGEYVIISDDFLKKKRMKGKLSGKQIAYVEKIVIERLKKMNRKIKVCLIGFSQGAAASLFFILNSHVKIDGVISLSGYIPYKKNRVVNPKIPMLALHGLHDDIINLDHAKESFNNFLDKENFKLITFNMGHEVIFEQLQHVKKFLKRI